MVVSAGAATSAVEPVPSWSFAPLPQEATVPSLLATKLSLSPAATLTGTCGLVTAAAVRVTGVCATWDELANACVPHHRRTGTPDALVVRRSACDVPADRLLTFSPVVVRASFAGERWSVVLALPSW